QAHFVTIQYVCGRNFDVGNEDSVSLSVRFEVAGGESGDLLLPARSAVDTPSMTRLTTWTSGAVQISMVGNAPVKADNVGTACPAPTPPSPDPQASMGEWSAPFDWPVVAVHLHLFPDGRVLSWGLNGDPQVWDPASGAFTALPAPSNVFCGGHTLL